MTYSQKTVLPNGLRGMDLLDTPAWNKGTAFEENERRALGLHGLLPPIEIAQCNNVFIFPAVGLGVVGSGASRVTDKMLLAAAKALGDHSPALKDPNGSLLPRVKAIREVAFDIAYAVAAKAQEEGLAPASDPVELRKKLAQSRWFPDYSVYEL